MLSIHTTTTTTTTAAAFCLAIRLTLTLLPLYRETEVFSAQSRVHREWGIIRIYDLQLGSSLPVVKPWQVKISTQNKKARKYSTYTAQRLLHSREQSGMLSDTIMNKNQPT